MEPVIVQQLLITLVIILQQHIIQRGQLAIAQLLLGQPATVLQQHITLAKAQQQFTILAKILQQHIIQLGEPVIVPLRLMEPVIVQLRHIIPVTVQLQLIIQQWKLVILHLQLSQLVTVLLHLTIPAKVPPHLITLVKILLHHTQQCGVQVIIPLHHKIQQHLGRHKERLVFTDNILIFRIEKQYI